MPISVVVVDDHAMLLESLVRALSDEPDIEVVATATSVDAGLDAVRRHHPDVIVVDQGLSTLDGAEAPVSILGGWPDATVLVLTPPNAKATTAAPLARQHHLEKIHAIERLAQTIRATCA
jgi:DNA-binding NarL/FixJ family response regulator